MKISEFVTHIKRDNALLYWTGFLNFILFTVCLVLFFFDSRLVTGINPWIKPMKFALSVGIYLWTFAWVLRYLKSKKSIAFISWGIAFCMVVENTIIALQAARGVQSHYNISSTLDSMLFSTMGTFIGINTAYLFYTFILFLFSETSLDKHMLLAWRAGLLLFLLGGVAGGMMIGNLSHTVGAPDGGAGIPFLNWSTLAGDLRVAHFITMHGLQVIPFVAFYISSRTKQPVVTTWAFVIFYSLACLRLHQVALAGRSFLDFM